MKPRFTDQPHFHMRSPRTSQSMADYASPLTLYADKSPRAGFAVVAFVCGILALLALVHGVLS